MEATKMENINYPQIKNVLLKKASFRQIYKNQQDKVRTIKRKNQAKEAKIPKHVNHPECRNQERF